MKRFLSVLIVVIAFAIWFGCLVIANSIDFDQPTVLVSGDAKQSSNYTTSPSELLRTNILPPETLGRE
jgi:hypothetical protein